MGRLNRIVWHCFYIGTSSWLGMPWSWRGSWSWWELRVHIQFHLWFVQLMSGKCAHTDYSGGGNGCLRQNRNNWTLTFYLSSTFAFLNQKSLLCCPGDSYNGGCGQTMTLLPVRSRPSVPNMGVDDVTWSQELQTKSWWVIFITNDWSFDFWSNLLFKMQCCMFWDRYTMPNLSIYKGFLLNWTVYAVCWNSWEPDDLLAWQLCSYPYFLGHFDKKTT